MEIKQPPHSIEAEQSVIGAILLNSESYSKVSDLLLPHHFYKNEHRIIYTAIRKIADKSKEFDTVTVGEHLESTGELGYSGGFAYLIKLANESPGSTNIKNYAKIVIERSALRNLILAANQISEMSYFTDGLSSDQILEKGLDILRHIDTKADTEIPSIEETVIAAVNQLEHRYNNQGDCTGLETGFKDLDASTLGLQKGELYVLGGRPAMGKSTLALNIAMNAVKNGKHVLFFSLELPKERIVDKCTSSLAKIPYADIKSGKIKDESWGSASRAFDILRDSNFRIDDKGGQTLQSIVMKSKKLDSEKKLDLIIVDYLQLVRVDGASRYEEVSEVSREFKALAKNLDVPVLALSQLSRNLEQRPDKRPRLSDLRESGQIEQDADLIAFIYRDEIYYPDHYSNKGVAELLIEKHRFGEVTKMFLTSQLEYSRFIDFQDFNYEPYEKKSGGFNG